MSKSITSAKMMKENKINNCIYFKYWFIWQWHWKQSDSQWGASEETRDVGFSIQDLHSFVSHSGFGAISVH